MSLAQEQVKKEKKRINLFFIDQRRGGIFVIFSGQVLKKLVATVRKVTVNMAKIKHIKLNTSKIEHFYSTSH